MRVLIVGGGVAGLTLAYWLQQYNHSPLVIEQSAGLRRDGYGIDFYGTGYDVAERMGIIDRLAAQSIPMEYIAYVNRAGRPVATLRISLMRRVMYGKYLALMHPTLEEALFDALGGAVEVRFGLSVRDLDAAADAVSVTFTDGSRDAFDLVVGADGVHSATRKLVFGPEEQVSHYLGYTVASFALADRYGIGQSWKMYVEPGRMVGAYVSVHDGMMNTFFLYRQAEAERVARDERLPRLREVFAGMGWITSQLLGDASDSESIFMDAVCQIRMPIWHKRRVALVGDAAYCPTLISGQGASLAMGGAYLLAEALRDCDDYEAAILRYEARMMPYVRRQQQGAIALAKSFAPSSRIGVLAQRVLLKVVLRDAFRGLLRRQFGAESILSPTGA